MSKARAARQKAYQIVINKNSCKACELCIFYCPAKHLKQSLGLNQKGVKPVVISQKTKCVGCGFCFLICPETCIEVYEK